MEISYKLWRQLESLIYEAMPSDYLTPDLRGQISEVIMDEICDKLNVAVVDDCD